MKKEYISDVWQLKQKGHENFEFVDVAVNDDNLLFIDPCLIERWNNAWAIKAMKRINSYFDKLFKAYNTCNRKRYEMPAVSCWGAKCNQIGIW